MMDRKRITSVCLAATFTAALLVSPAWADEESPWAVADNVLNVNNPLPEYKEIVIEEEPVVEREGQFTDEEREFSYSYTAPRDGYYLLWIDDFTPNCGASVSWTDPYGNKLSNSDVQLEEGLTYDITVWSGNNTHFKVSVFQQKPTTDLSGYIKAKDQIAFDAQHNYYTYTAKNTGTHVLFLDLAPNIGVWYGVYDSYGNEIKCSNTWYGDKHVSVELEKDETYTLEICSSDHGYYSVYFGEKKPLVDVSGYSVINDAFDYRKQVNNYSFNPPIEGKYRIYCEGKQVDSFKVYSEEGDDINPNPFNDYQCSLEEGAEYSFVVYGTDDGISDYTITIDYPSEAQAYLDQVASGVVETEADGTAEVDPKYAELEARNQELESELAALQEKYDLLTDILGDSGLQIDGE